MKNTRPYWYRLIKKLKYEGVITTGLTIPYIFGAYKELGEPFRDVRDLIQVVLDSETDEYPVIQKCHVINKHVIMLEEKTTCNKKYIKDIKLKSVGSNILFISLNTNLGKDIDKVCWNLTKEYENQIKKNEFSWNNKEGLWKQFSKDEILRITSLRKNG